MLSAPPAKARGVRSVPSTLPTFLAEAARLALVWVRSDFWTDALRLWDAKASGHDLPLIRTFDESLVCCPQARLRTFPVGLVPGTRGSEVCWIQIGGQKRRVEVALHWPDTATALMPALGQRLFDGLTAAMAKLRQFRAVGGNFVQGAARTCNGASQMVDEHPWRTKAHTFAVELLPAFIRKFLGENRVAYRDNLMRHPTMQALAVGRQLALFGRFAPSGGFIAAAALPGGITLASLLGPSLLVIVLRVGHTSLPIHLALQPTQLLLLRSQLLG
jgi:hypothetical protein